MLYNCRKLQHQDIAVGRIKIFANLSKYPKEIVKQSIENASIIPLEIYVLKKQKKTNNKLIDCKRQPANLGQLSECGKNCFAVIILIVIILKKVLNSN